MTDELLGGGGLKVLVMIDPTESVEVWMTTEEELAGGGIAVLMTIEPVESMED